MSRGTRKRRANGSPAAARRSLSSRGHLAHVGVEEPGALGAGSFGVAGLGGREIAIGQALVEDGFGDFAVQGEALGLAVLLVPAEIEPAEAVEDGIERGFGVALDVGVVDAQDHGAAVVGGRRAS